MVFGLLTRSPNLDRLTGAFPLAVTRSALRVSDEYCLVSSLAFIVPSPYADDPAGLTAPCLGDHEIIVADTVQGAKAGLAPSLHLGHFACPRLPERHLQRSGRRPESPRCGLRGCFVFLVRPTRRAFRVVPKRRHKACVSVGIGLGGGWLALADWHPPYGFA